MIPNYANVLVVTDFSITGNNAIEHAFAIAAPQGHVHLLHVIKHDESPSPLYPHYAVDEVSTPEKRQKAIQGSEEHLRSLVPGEASARGVQSEVATVIAPEIAETIVKQAHERHANVIVLGAHVRRGLGHLFRGSVAMDVLAQSDVPVLLVRSP
jgi:nucleotide-binding universal stress UspA family protein